jgi:hypothetical protein
MSVANTVHVLVDRDGWDYLAIWSSVVADFIAVGALVVALVTRRDIDTDRRHVFELGVLRDIAETWSEAQGWDLSATMRTRAQMVPDLIKLREWIDAPRAGDALPPGVVPPVRPGDPGYEVWQAAGAERSRVWSTYTRDMLIVVRAEIDAAIQKRVRS